ncbi:MAG TPA: YfjI family protein [Kofleriaceae bacterium]
MRAEADRIRTNGHNRNAADGSVDHSPPRDAAAPPEPLRRTILPPAPYPGDALGDVLGPAARALHDTVQAPLALCGQSVLAAASLAAQPHADVSIDGRRYPTTLWCLSIAESGERKTAVDKIALAPHIEHEREQIELAERAAIKHAAKLAAWEATHAIAKKIKKGGIDEVREALEALGPAPEPAPTGILLVREPTIEALQKIFLRGATSLGLYADEGATWFGGHAMSQDHAMRTIGALCKLWDDGTSDRVRAGDGSSKIYGRRLALHMMCQPIIAEKILSDELLTGQGFLARCCLAWPATTAGTRTYRTVDPNCDAAVRRYADRMRALLARAPRTRDERPAELNPPALVLTEEAKMTWIAAYNAIEAEIAPTGAYNQIRPWASKAAEQVLRVAGVLTLVSDPRATRIGIDAITGASQLVGWHMGEAVRLVDTATVPPKVKRAEAVLAWARERGIAVVDSRTLCNRGPNIVRTADAVSEAMEVLVLHGWATPLKHAIVGDKRVRRAWELRLSAPGESQVSQSGEE